MTDEMAQDESYEITSMLVPTMHQVIALDQLTRQFEFITFKSEFRYKLASEIISNQKDLFADLDYVRKNYSTGTQIQLTEATHIGALARRNFDALAEIYLREDMSDFVRENIEESMWRLQRISQLVTNRTLSVRGRETDLDQWNLQERINSAYNQSIQSDETTYGQGYQEIDISGILSTFKWNATLVMDSFINYYLKFLLWSPALQKQFNVFAKQLVTAVNGLTQAQSQLFQWGDFKTNPIGALVGIMGGMNSVLTSYMTMASIAIGGVGHIIEDTSQQKDKAKKKQNKDEKDDMFFKMLLSTSNMIVNALSDLTNVIVSLVMMSVQLFISVLQTMMKLLKTIQETSPVLKGVLEYISLAVTMFFLPFFTVLAEPLLQALMGIMARVVTFSVNLSSSFKQMLEQEGQGQEQWDIVQDELKYILTNLFEKLMPKALELVKPLSDFILDFINVIINNQDLIKDMLETGIKAYQDLAHKGFLKQMIGLQNTVFRHIHKSRIIVTNQIKMVIGVQRLGFLFVEKMMNDVILIIYALFTQLGQITGAVVAYRAQQVATLLSLGLLAPSIPAQVQIGQLAGAASGLIVQNEIVDEFIKPMQIDDLDELIPQFAKGGKVEKMNGGLYAIVAENGEGEYAIPESKLNMFRGNDNIIVRISGKTYIKSQVDDVIRKIQNDPTIRLTKE